LPSLSLCCTAAQLVAATAAGRRQAPSSARPPGRPTPGIGRR
jgi:hypothetical protein